MLCAAKVLQHVMYAGLLGVHERERVYVRFSLRWCSYSGVQARGQGIRRGEGVNIVWDAEPLGIESDVQIALRLCVTRQAVAYARRQRGIKSPAKPTRPKCDPETFRQELTGEDSDRVIAERHGLVSAQVALARRKLGLRPKRKRWDDKPLGSGPDRVVHALNGGVGYSGSNAARLARVRLGIAPWCRSEERKCPCGSTFKAFHMRQRYCSPACQRYHWQLVNVDGMTIEAADLAIAIWAYKRTMKRRTQNVVKQSGITRSYSRRAR